MKFRFQKEYCVAIVPILLTLAPLAAAQESSSKPKIKGKTATASALAANTAPSTNGIEGTAKNGASPADSSKLPKRADSEGQYDPRVYRIGPEDDLQISVWREPELSLNTVVRPDGKITLPLLNDIFVVGLQTSELQALLTEKLRAYLNEPQVTVIVRGIKSRKVYLVGQVSRPGQYSLVARKTVLELLAEAGGLSLFAKKGSIYVLREVEGKHVRFPFNYKKAVAGKNPGENIELLPGDMIVVP